MPATNTMLLGTRKGLVVYRQNGRNTWQYERTEFLGQSVSIATFDPVNRTWWAMLDHGHWGCKLHRSNDGTKWEEVEAPKYPEGEMINEETPATTKYLWAFSRGGNKQNGRIYIGTEPGGLFQSDNNGDTFSLVKSLWDHPTRVKKWFGGGRDYPGIHSILVDPRDHDHIYVGISCAGVFETHDGGNNWTPKNRGLIAEFLPDANAEVGQDPHLVVMNKSNPDVLWQQNHCGIFKTSDGGNQWEKVSQQDGPAHFGFAIAVHDQDPDVAWVVPGISDEIRVAYDKRLCVCRTDDGGKHWKTLTDGLPNETAFDITYRHALDVNDDLVAFGTTTGNLYISGNGGERWNCLSNNLPMVYSLELASV